MVEMQALVEVDLVKELQVQMEETLLQMELDKVLVLHQTTEVLQAPKEADQAKEVPKLVVETQLLQEVGLDKEVLQLIMEVLKLQEVGLAKGQHLPMEVMLLHLAVAQEVALLIQVVLPLLQQGQTLTVSQVSNTIAQDVLAKRKSL